VSLSGIFIERPVATTLLTIGVALAGAVGFRLLPVSPLPQIDFPTIQVYAGLPGASPETMATSVAAPLERQFARIAGVSEMTSTSTLGSTNISLQFDLGRNIDGAARDVEAAINAARGTLPANLPSNPTYRKVNPADAPVLILALTSDTMDVGRMYEAASNVLQQRLSQVEGVGQVIVGGSSLPAVRVELNPGALEKYGIGLEEVRTALSRTNVNRPTGQLSDGGRSWEIRTNDQLRRADDYLPVVVAYRHGAPVRLSDVAQVDDSVEDLRATGLANGKPAVLVILFRQPGANIIETVDRVRAALPQLEAALPGAIRVHVAVDRSPPIRASLRDVEITLVISTVLVILVVFAFLRSVRATLVPSVAVPVSLVGTFGVMYLLGYSLDSLSLMALTVATGFVVDDAIVVLENISRHLEAGMAPREAALRGARETAFTVLSMSLSLVAVFLPILLMGGIVGRLFREFAATLSIAIAISLVVSLTTTPMMCAAILRPERPGAEGRLSRASERAFLGLHRRYETSLSWALRHPRFMLGLTIATVALNAWLFSVVPKGFFPQQDTARLAGAIQAAQSISFQAMREKLASVVRVIGEDPAVDNVVGFTGGGGGGATRNSARVFVALRTDGEQRPSADGVIARLRGRLAGIVGAPAFLQSVQDLRIGGRISNAQFQYTLQDQSLRELEAWAPRIEQRFRSIPQIVDVSSDQQNKGLESTLVIDRPTASRLGITPKLLDDTLYDAFGQRQVSIIYSPLNQYHVVMEVEPRFWQRADVLRDLHVLPGNGSQVPLTAFTRFEPTATALAVAHQGQFPAVTLSFNLAPGVALGDAVQAIETATREMGLPPRLRGSFQGTAQAFQASLANEPLLILSALVAIYIVLGVLYESYVHPITILSTLPSAGVGAILALLLCRTELSVIALIGIFLLIGIVKKNAIMMIDFALESERGQGRPPLEAIYEACLLRFRPILMTTMAALLGALPLAVGGGFGAELRRPLGISIVGGLLVSQMLTLYTTPVVYLYLDRLRIWLRGRRRIAAAAGAAAVTLLSACAVGPDYVRPEIESPAAFKELEGWKTARPQDDAARGAWWTLFGDDPLAALEQRVETSNQSLAVAEAQFREARALVGAARASYYPNLGIGVGVTRSRGSANLAGRFNAEGSHSDYSLPLDASWEPDIWGRIRRNVESNEASAKASAADLAAARLSLEAELATDYFSLRSLDAQKRLLDDTVAAYVRSLELTRNRYAAGVASRVDVAQAETQLEQTRAQALDVGVQRAQLEHAIAVLVGAAASDFAIAPAPLEQPVADVPVGLPAALLERRPDIAGAERRVAAANAQIGVAEAAYFPTVTLSASGGFEASDPVKWLEWPSRFWSVGPSITETVFDGGLRGALTDQARAAYDASVASYRETVLAAFQEVEDELAALRILEQEASVQDAAVQAARESVRLTTNQYKAGIVSYLDVVTTQATALTNERTAVEILGRRMVASVLLVKALGGGWNVAALPPV
jgi:multidrug efflux pump